MKTFHKHAAIAAIILAGRVPAMAGGLSQDELRHYYRIFTDTCYLAPTTLQQETLDVAELVFQVTDGWRPASSDEAARASAEAQRLYSKLREVYPTYVIRITADSAEVLEQPTEAVVYTPHLLRLILVEVVNASGVDQVLTPIVEEAAPYGRPQQIIPSGASLPILVPVVMTTGVLDGKTITMLPAGNGGAVLSCQVPARIEAGGVLQGTAINSATGAPYPSRVYLEGSDRILRHANEFALNQTLTEKPVVFRPAMMKVPFSYTTGEFTAYMPAGPGRIVLERGYETPFESKDFTIAPNGTASVEIASRRERDMLVAGWISGDTHIHWAVNAWNENEDLDLLAMVQRAEDLRVANNLTLYQWVPDGQTFIKPDQFPMGPVEHLSDGEYHIQMAEEFRNDNHYGHLNLLNLKELIEPIATGPGSGGPPGTIDYPINAEIIRRTREQGGISIEAHNLGPFNASGVAANVILGMSDVLDQIEPMNYYNFLNTGVRIGLGNGSDHPARLVGICRVYVHAPGPLDYPEWCRRLAEGRSFTTSGPLLTMEVNGQPIGEILDVESGTALTISVSAWSRNPLGRVEIVSNGSVVESVSTNERSLEITFQTEATEPRWFVARASRGESFNALDGPDIAHTSAIYIDVEGKGVFHPDAARLWIGNVRIHRQRLIDTGNFENEEQRAEAIEYVDRAIARYQQLIDDYETGAQ